jgi:hypothetical protein
VVIFLIFWGVCVLISIVAGLIYIPTAYMDPFSCILTSICCCFCCLEDSHSDLGKMESQWVWFAFPWWLKDVYIPFFFFFEPSVQFICPFTVGLFVLLVFNFFELCISCILIFYQMNDWQTFFHSVCCHFILVIVSFSVQEHSNLMQPQLSVLAIISWANVWCMPVSWTPFL